MAELSQIVHSDPEILGGTPVFVGTRVPAQSLFDYLEGGETLDEFLHQFPSVTREQAKAVIDLARATVRPVHGRRIRRADHDVDQGSLTGAANSGADQADSSA